MAARLRLRRRGRFHACACSHFEVGKRLSGYVEWKRQIHRPRGRIRRDGQCTIHNGLKLLAPSQFVVPLDEFAYQARLIERLLGPVNGRGTRGDMALFGDRSASRGDQHRDAGTRGVDDPSNRICGACNGMHHDGLGFAGHHGVAVRHRDSGDFVNHGDRVRPIPPALRLALRKSLDERREVGAGPAAEEEPDPSSLEQFEKPLRYAVDLQSLDAHGVGVRQKLRRPGLE